MDQVNSTTLAAWHAKPLNQAQAQQLFDDVQQQRKQAVLGGEQCVLCQTHEFIAQFWLGKSVLNSLELAVQIEADQAQRALLLLVYGQLLLACKLKAAFEFLDRGLQEAALLLSPTDYFRVVNRHELLSVLPLFSESRAPADISSLENEARILLRLKQGKPRLTGNSGRTPRR